MHHYDQRKHIIGYIYNDSQSVFQKKIGQLGGYEYSSKAKKTTKTIHVDEKENVRLFQFCNNERHF